MPADSASEIVKFIISIGPESCTNAKAKYSSVVPPDPSVHFYHCSYKKDCTYSIIERRVPELIPVLCSQPVGDVSRKPGGRKCFDDSCISFCVGKQEADLVAIRIVFKSIELQKFQIESQIKSRYFESCLYSSNIIPECVETAI